MPIIQVNILEGRSKEKIEQLIIGITDVVSETLESPKEAIRVLVTEVPKTHWGSGGTPMSKK